MSARLAALLFCTVASASAQPLSTEALQARIDAYLAPLVGARQFSGVVRVQRGDSVVYERAAGPRDATGGALRADDVLRVGSITKPMTAAVVLRLAARGALALDSPACGYAGLAGIACPQGWADVTVRQCLNQTAGLPEYIERPTFPFMKNQDATPAQLLASLRGVPLLHPPGAAFRYSNTHYILLGTVVEGVTGAPFAEALRSDVAAPLGLGQTAMESASFQPVQGFQTVGALVVSADSLNPSVAYAAGGAVSTAAEVATFARALVRGPYLADAVRDSMLTPATPSGYGLGVIAVPYQGPVPDLQGTRIVWHNGAIDGFRSIFLTIPERDLTIVVLANLFDADADGIGRDVLHLAYGLDVAPTLAEAAVALPPEALVGLVGTYRLGLGFAIEIRAEGSQLVAQATGQGPTELFAASEDEFFARVVPARIEFERGLDGVATHLTLVQEGQRRRAPRVSE